MDKAKAIEDAFTRAKKVLNDPPKKFTSIDDLLDYPVDKQMSLRQALNIKRIWNVKETVSSREVRKLINN